jgi:hypothetical protein
MGKEKYLEGCRLAGSSVLECIVLIRVLFDVEISFNAQNLHLGMFGVTNFSFHYEQYMVQSVNLLVQLA